jgi:myosin-1
MIFWFVVLWKEIIASCVVFIVDKKFLETCSQIHSSHAHFSQNTRAFCIKHYAGDVNYTVGKFGESNKDALSNELILLMKSTRDKLIGHLFGEEVDLDDRKQAPTAGNRIRTQCQALVTALMECSPHYVRCIKSNDAKQALTMDRRRVEFQVKYLGLSENVKVRRAGFAYRTEYGRFLDRFAIMCPRTYPDWKGSDKEGCKEIIKTVAAQLEGITKEEVQMGKSMIFVRKPETYFALEKLREKCIGDFVVRIQRCWRKHSASREFVKMATAMGKFYTERSKMRRRDSIFRPYQGDYLGFLGPHADRIRDGIFRVIDYYDPNENIVFADANCWQVVKGPTPNAPLQLHRVFVLTTGAIYFFETPQDAAAKAAIHPTKQIPE